MGLGGDSSIELVNEIPSPQNPHQADQHPKDIQQRISSVFFEDGAPREQEGIDRVEDPHEHERTIRSEPADEAEAEDAHHHADHFKYADVFQDKSINSRHGFPRKKSLAKYTRHFFLI